MCTQHFHGHFTTVTSSETGWTNSGAIKYTHTFSGPLSGTNRVSRNHKGKTNPDFTEARDSEWQWHQLGHMQVCTSLQTDNHASTPRLSFLQAGCPPCRPTNSIKALKAWCNQVAVYNLYSELTSIVVIVLCCTHTHAAIFCLTSILFWGYSRCHQVSFENMRNRF